MIFFTTRFALFRLFFLLLAIKINSKSLILILKVVPLRGLKHTWGNKQTIRENNKKVNEKLLQFEFFHSPVRFFIRFFFVYFYSLHLFSHHNHQRKSPWKSSFRWKNYSMQVLIVNKTDFICINIFTPLLFHNYAACFVVGSREQALFM